MVVSFESLSLLTMVVVVDCGSSLGFEHTGCAVELDEVDLFLGGSSAAA